MPITLYDIYSLLPEIYMLVSVCVLLVFGVLCSTFQLKGNPLAGVSVGWLSFQASFVALLLILFSSTLNMPSWNYLLISDAFSKGSRSMLLLIFMAWFFLSLSYSRDEKINSFEYWILSLLGVVGVLFVLQSNDLISMYLSIEFQSLSFYVLTSFKRTSEFSTESGLKYFILGAFSSALLLFGLSILYSLTGLTNFDDYAKLFLLPNESENFGLSIGLTFVSAALLFKLSAAPFHMWSPDVYEGAPTSVTAYLSILPKLGILSLLLRFYLVGFYDVFLIWQKMILSSAYLSILVGTLAAFHQKKLKRFIAYSSINHIGFFLIGLVTGDLEGTFGILFYLVAYVIMTFGMFFFLMSFRFFTYPNHRQIRYIKDLKGLGLANPVLALSLTLILFSMTGIPPLVGFFSKLFILLSPIKNQFYSLSLFAVLMSCVSCFYYIRFIKIIYFEEIIIWKVTRCMSKLNSFLLGLFILLIAFLFLDLEILTIFLTKMSLSLN